MNEPLVSIIVPSYRHEKYILDCLRSLHAQTYPRLELIVIDDQSPDRTFEFTEKLLNTAFADRFENVILRRQAKNAGAHVAINLGLSLAGGSYIAIVNSDDKFRPRRIEALHEACLREKSEFAFSSVETFSGPEDAKGPGGQQHFPDGLLLLELRQRLAIAREPSLGYALLRTNVAISTGNFFFSKRLCDAIGGFQPLRYCHDWDFILQALVRTQPVFVAEILYDYRLHATNTFRSTQHLAHVETEVVLRRFFRALLRGHISNPSCPSPATDHGYFNAFVAQAKYQYFWAKESGLPIEGQRSYDRLAQDRSPSLSGFQQLSELLQAAQ